MTTDQFVYDALWVFFHAPMLWLPVIAVLSVLLPLSDEPLWEQRRLGDLDDID